MFCLASQVIANIEHRFRPQLYVVHTVCMYSYYITVAIHYQWAGLCTVSLAYIQQHTHLAKYSGQLNKTATSIQPRLGRIYDKLEAHVADVINVLEGGLI